MARQPGACQRLNDGTPTPYACPGHPQFRAFMLGWIRAALAAGADVLFWDEPHLWIAAWEGLPASDGRFSLGSREAQERWRRRQGRLPSRHPGPEAERYRTWLLVDFLRWATRAAKRIRPSVRNAVCLLPQAEPWPNPLWEQVARMASVDILATDPYWKQSPASTGPRRSLEGWVDLQAGRLLALAQRHGKEAQAWLQLFGLRQRDHADIPAALRLLRRAGIRNVGAWGFRGCAAYSGIASQDPDGAWHAWIQALKAARKADQQL